MTEDDLDWMEETDLLPSEDGPGISLVGCNDPKVAQEAIKTFFKGLNWVIGGAVPNRVMTSDKYLNLIRQIDLNNALDLGYPLIVNHGKKVGQFARSGPYVEDIEITMSLYVLYRCASLHVPQGYVGGIFLMYLELCEGVKLA